MERKIKKRQFNLWGHLLRIADTRIVREVFATRDNNKGKGRVARVVRQV